MSICRRAGGGVGSRGGGTIRAELDVLKADFVLVYAQPADPAMN